MSWATERWQSQIKDIKQTQMGNILQIKEKIGSLANADFRADCWLRQWKKTKRHYFFFFLNLIRFSQRTACGHTQNDLGSNVVYGQKF